MICAMFWWLMVLAVVAEAVSVEIGTRTDAYRQPDGRGRQNGAGLEW